MPELYTESEKSKFSDKITEIQQKQFTILCERNAVYGSSYEKVGKILQILFPNGIKLETKEQHQQFDIIKQIIGKITRLANNFPDELHTDSVVDIGGYAAILQILNNKE